MILLKKINDKDGFSLVEIIIIIALGGIILTAVFSSFSSGIRNFYFTEEKSATQREIRFLTSYIAENIRNSTRIELVSDYNEALDSGEAIIGFDGAEFKYRDNSGTDRTVIEFTKTQTVSFELNTENNSPDSLIINIGDVPREIILNNFSSTSANDTDQYIKFKK
ncbi:hypothetical protein HSACCH_01283 [Halanaerobium saccharolyticum subsp. saccharolyticum DSM 6643]|uniref:Prepilin-type N-terminal cleavage/methylation domain-containing protein n=1 Tax=Halanaerobium saccharolyticum subsp. saccharolyticum DSM 6643 TaxID=1293054 RepID=M5E0W3_9FIRM|nr:prepilin-type N-terminal cleavage/methylation domain-containing protein [Halanaerobium saccharolyticum]CCU79375.1 hypothetical protein HSACCH_01283 [Halanaerobium saccharolyticum subsp. saccharolyticum DSM 6643]